MNTFFKGIFVQYYHWQRKHGHRDIPFFAAFFFLMFLLMVYSGSIMILISATIFDLIGRFPMVYAGVFFVEFIYLYFLLYHKRRYEIIFHDRYYRRRVWTYYSIALIVGAFLTMIIVGLFILVDREVI